MNAISEVFSRGFQQLVERMSGPFHFRLLITPAVAIVYAIRAGLRDAREAHPPFLWEILTRPEERQRLRRSWLNDIGKMIVVVFVIDAAYQVFVLRFFYVVQALILVVALAMLPYALVRGITNRLARGFSRRRRTGPASEATPRVASGTAVKR